LWSGERGVSAGAGAGEEAVADPFGELGQHVVEWDLQVVGEFSTDEHPNALALSHDELFEPLYGPGSAGQPWLPRIISDVKLRSFISPGETLDLEVRRIGCSENRWDVAVESRIGQRLIGSADIQFTSTAHP
jgi:3-hydroxymyristoyl/3-hydroxydecanoyl-(acyl carrier protein) dehydratase